MGRDIVMRIAMTTLATAALVLAPALVMASASPSPGTDAASPSTGSAPPTAAPSASLPTVSPLVGQWHLAKTCRMIVDALTAAGQTDLIAQDVPELLMGSDDGARLPADYDPTRPCADALPPTEHSHTFWPDGMFNSYDQYGNQVDDGFYTLVDADTVTIGSMTFDFEVQGDAISFDVVVPDDCTSQSCRGDLGWAFSVANPGQWWARVTSGPHVPQ